MSTEKVFTLKGREFVCYQAGMSIGIATALSEASANVQRFSRHYEPFLKQLSAQIILELDRESELRGAVVNLPELAIAMLKVSEEFSNHAAERKRDADARMGKLASENIASVERWRPPWRAWGMLVLAMCVATAVSTVVGLYASAKLGDTVGSCVGSTVERKPGR